MPAHRRRFLRKLGPLAAAMAAVVGVLLPGLPASASVGTTWTSSGQAGYVASNRWFRHLQATLYLPSDASSWSQELQVYGGSVSLWSKDGTIVQLGISAPTSPAAQSYAPGVNVYRGQTLVASTGQPAVHDKFCQANGPCSTGSGLVQGGQGVTFRMYYNRTAGTVAFSEKDGAGDSYYGWVYVGTGEAFNRAKVTSDLGTAPWDASNYLGPANGAPMWLAHWYAASLTTYGGIKGTLVSGYWATHRLLFTLGGGPYAWAALYPGSLQSAGSDFSTWLNWD